MSTIKINTESAGPTFISLTPGSTYAVKCGETGSSFAKTIIEETDSSGAIKSTITITKYVAGNEDVNWEKLNEAAYQCIELDPSQFEYPTFNGFTKEDYLCRDLRNGFENIINNALSNDLPAEYSEWLAWVPEQNMGEEFAECRDAAQAKGEDANVACTEALAKCPDTGYYYDSGSGLQCDCNTENCCSQLATQVTNDVIEACAPPVTKKHQYIFQSVAVVAPEE
jgi:hypothetical protein